MPFDALPAADVAAALAILRAARAGVSRPGGWCQKLFSGPGGSHCTVGWVHAAANQYSLGLEPTTSLGALCRILSRTPAQLYRWNDSPRRTQADVIALFDAAIARLEGAL